MPDHTPIYGLPLVWSKPPTQNHSLWQLFVRRYLLKTFTEFDIDAVPAAEALAMMIYHGVEFEEAYPPRNSKHIPFTGSWEDDYPFHSLKP